MSKERVELSLEELEAVNGALWSEIADFAVGLWNKTKNVIKKLPNWG